MRRGVVLMVFLVAQCCQAQKEVATQENAWLMYMGNHRVSEKWGLHMEYQFRRAEIFQDWQQSLLRLGVDYYRKTGEQVTVGYAWIRSFPYGEQPIAHSNNEHRVWQQFMTKSKLNCLELQHRYRIEQRFIENWQSNVVGPYEMIGYLYRQRVRYRFQMVIPVGKRELSDNTLFFAASDEIFLGFGKGIGKNVLDQNRIFGGVGWRFNAACNVQFGYLNQYILKRDGIHAERNHTFQTTLTYNLDWRNKEE
jgi:hypothetical protein